jgi:hypothetical protein
VIAHVVADEERTAVFARYSFVGAFFGALGAVSVGTVEWLEAVIPPPAVTAALFATCDLTLLWQFSAIKPPEER